MIPYNPQNLSSYTDSELVTELKRLSDLGLTVSGHFRIYLKMEVDRMQDAMKFDASVKVTYLSINTGETIVTNVPTYFG